jgi:hypothetical protein
MKTTIYFPLALLCILCTIKAHTQSPGGVSSGLVNWYKCDAGIGAVVDNTPITQWNDQSGTAKHASQSTLINRPRYRTAGANGYGGVEFIGGGRFLNVDFSSLSNSDYTIFIVSKRAASSINQYVLGNQTGTPNPNFQIGYPSSVQLTQAHYGNALNLTVPAYNVATQAPTVMVAEFNSSSGKAISETYDGTKYTASNTSTTKFSYTSTSGVIGRGSSFNGLIGQIYEIAIYNRVLTSTEKKQVQTYFNTKYGVSIPIADHLYYTNTTYASDLFGIGKDLTTQGLNQTISSSENSDDMLELSAPSSLDNGDYLFMGNDNRSRSFVTYTGANCAIKSIFDRKWKVREVGEVGTLTMKFNLTGISGYTANELALVVDNNSNGFDDDTPVTGTLSGNTLTFAGIDLANNATVALVAYIPKWYAVVSGNSSGAVWASSLNGTPQALGGTCSRYDLEIKNGVTVTNDMAFVCKSLIVPSGATMNLGSYNITLYGDLSVSGTLNAQTSTIYFNGTSTQALTGTQAVTLYNMISNNTTVLDNNSSALRISRMLQINAGTFNTNQKVTILSDASGTGSIAASTGTISGNLTVQRYSNRTNAGWVNVCSPVQNGTLQDWDDNLITSGFPGSDYPSYNFNNITWYNETVSGNKNAGYTGATNITNTVKPKFGYFIYMNAGAMNLDVTGPIFQGNQTLPVTFTNTGNASGDGWCLVGNPYASAIDWNASGWTKTNMANAIYVWSPAVNQYATYINGVAANGGSNIIPSSQSFFVQATALNPILTASESVKTMTQGTYRSTELDGGLLSIGMSGPGGTDEVSLAWKRDATAQYDVEHDALKLRSPSPDVPTLAIVDDNGEELSINCLERINSGVKITLHAIVSANGIYTMRFGGLSQFANGSCVSLTERSSGRTFILREDEELELMMITGEESNIYDLSVSSPVIATIKDATCYGDTDGSVTVHASREGARSLTWKNSSDEVIHVSKTSGMATTLTGLAAGVYSIELNGTENCSSTKAVFVIAQPAKVRIHALTESPTCPNTPDGSITLSAAGGYGDYSFRWNDGVQEKQRVGLTQGNYEVVATDKMGCMSVENIMLMSDSPIEIRIEGMKEMYELSAGTVDIDAFTQPIPETNFEWYIDGSGPYSTTSQISTSINSEGEHSIVLVATSPWCTEMAEAKFNVAKPVSHSFDNDLMAYYANNCATIQTKFGESRQLQITIYNPIGQRIVETWKGAAESQRIDIPLSAYAGEAIIVVTDAYSGETKTFRVICIGK